MWGVARLAIRRWEQRGDAGAPPRTEVPAPQRDDVSAARRAFRRWPHLSPADGTRAAFDQWLFDTGQRLSAVEADEAFHDMRALMAFDAMTTAPVAVVEKPEAASRVPMGSVLLPTRRTLEAAAAAEAFLAWVRIACRCGTYSSQQFRALYLEHCAADDILPLADRTLRTELLIRNKYPGVIRAKGDAQLRGKRGQRRCRPTLWTIAPLPGVSDEIPWDDLPKRVAA